MLGKDEPLPRFYFRIQSRKNSAVALVAVARNLVLRLYRMLREEIDYDEFRRQGRDASAPDRTKPSSGATVLE